MAWNIVQGLTLDDNESVVTETGPSGWADDVLTAELLQWQPIWGRRPTASAPWRRAVPAYEPLPALNAALLRAAALQYPARKADVSF